MAVQVKQFNREAKQRWENDCHKWDYRTGGMPFIGMYLFYRDNGWGNEEAKNGWVAKYRIGKEERYGYKLCKNKEEAERLENE